MKGLLALAALCLLMTACTYSITMVHTSGQASDVVDEAQTPTANTTASASLTK